MTFKVDGWTRSGNTHFDKKNLSVGLFLVRGVCDVGIIKVRSRIPMYNLSRFLENF